MIRNLARNLFRFLAALILLALGVCAVEVGLRAWRLQAGSPVPESAGGGPTVIVPSAVTWIDVRPLLDRPLSASDGGQGRLRTNEFGLRGPPVPVPKRQGVYRILCLGGDLVFGTPLSENDVLSTKLQQYLERYAGREIEVINGGCPGAGPLVNLLRYRAQLAVLQPDLVLLCLTPEDLSRDRLVRGAVRLDAEKRPAYASHPAASEEGNCLLDGICQEFATVNLALQWAGKTAGLEHAAATRPVPSQWRGAVDLGPVVSLSQLVQGNFGALSVSLGPSVWALAPDSPGGMSPPRLSGEQVRQAFTEARQEGRIVVHDPLPDFRQLPNLKSLFSAETGELGKEGVDLYARQLTAHLLESVADLRSSPAVGVPRPATPATSVPFQAPTQEFAPPGPPRGVTPDPIPFPPQARAFPEEPAATAPQ